MVLRASQIDCSFNVEWQEPDNGGSPITGYQFLVQNSGGQWVSVKDCNKATSVCKLSMEALTQWPFNLRQGMKIVVEARATNAIGHGPWSLKDDSVKLITKPGVIQMPEVAETTPSSVKLTWTKLEGSVTYQVLFALGAATEFSEVATTTENSYIGPNAHYRFKVRPVNICGAGPDSPVLSVARVPTQMTPVKTEQDGCALKMTWVPPTNDGGSPIEAYKVEIQGSNGKFYQLVNTCQTDPKVLECSVDMNKLFEAPFRLLPGLRVIVRVSAGNAQGFGKPSPLNDSGPTMMRKPPQMQAPRLTGQTLDSVELQWPFVRAGAAGETTAYTVLQADATGAFQPLDRVTATELTVAGLEKGKTYRFKVRAESACRSGDFSPELVVSMDLDLPAQMEQIRAVVDRCSVRFAWVAPNDGQSPILKYRIEVQGSDGKFYQLEEYCGNDPLVNSCSVPMPVLGAKPFSLEDGKIIAVRAQAENEFGLSTPSAVTTSAKMILVPRTVGKPSIEEETASSVRISWNPASDSAGTVYEVFRDENTRGKFARLDETTKTTFTAEKVTGARSYRFKVRARNVCGSSDYSDELKVNILFAPARMQSVVLSTEGCDVRVDWTAPDSRGAPIQKYNIEAQSSKGAFFPVPACGQKADSQSCLIPMATLQAKPFGLQRGEDIVVRASAYNRKGWGLHSNVNSDGAVLKTVPLAVETPVAKSIEGQTVVFTWPKLADADDYEIGLDSGSGLFAKFAVTKSTEFSFTRRAFKKQPEFAVYKFRVRARNACGFGPLSSELPVRFTVPPSQMQPLTSSVESCSVRFTWTPPNNGGAAITGYTVEVRSRTGEFQPLLSHCQAGAAAT